MSLAGGKQGSLSTPFSIDCASSTRLAMSGRITRSSSNRCVHGTRNCQANRLPVRSSWAIVRTRSGKMTDARWRAHPGATRLVINVPCEDGNVCRAHIRSSGLAQDIGQICMRDFRRHDAVLVPGLSPPPIRVPCPRVSACSRCLPRGSEVSTRQHTAYKQSREFWMHDVVETNRVGRAQSAATMAACSPDCRSRFD